MGDDSVTCWLSAFPADEASCTVSSGHSIAPLLLQRWMGMAADENRTLRTAAIMCMKKIVDGHSICMVDFD